MGSPTAGSGCYANLAHLATPIPTSASLILLVSCLAEIGTDVGERSVFHAKASRDRAELGKTKPLVEVPGMDITLDYGVELEDAESVGLGLLKAIQDKFLADVLSATGRTDGVAGVCDVPASPDIVGMKDVKSDNPDAFIRRHADIRLRREKLSARLARQRLLLREGVARIDHLVPNGDHRIKVTVLVFAHNHVFLSDFVE